MDSAIFVSSKAKMEFEAFTAGKINSSNSPASVTTRLFFTIQSILALMCSRAAQNFWRLNYQTPLFSLAQNLNVYQVSGPSVNILPLP